MSVYCQQCRFSYAGPCPKHGGAAEQPESDQPVQTSTIRVSVNEKPEKQPEHKPSLIKRVFKKK